LEPATLQVAGNGLQVNDAISHPPGILFSGGYDADKNELFLSSVMGHPRAVAAAGGEPSDPNVSGLRVLIVSSGIVYWTTDSMSLPRGLNEVESDSVQKALEIHFHSQSVRRVEKLEDIPR
jgi:hypothetical protein